MARITRFPSTSTVKRCLPSPELIIASRQCQIVRTGTGWVSTPVPMLHDTRGHSKRFIQPMTRIDSYLYSFFPSAIKLWNSLPQHVIDSKDYDQFKQRLAGLATIINVD